MLCAYLVSHGCGAPIAGAKACYEYFLSDSMGSKKKRKKCEICMKHDHDACECTYICKPCQKDNACAYWCMMELCMDFYKIIKKSHRASSYDSMERVLEKLNAFERLLEGAWDFLEGYEGRRVKSCSTKKGIRRLQKSCLHLKEKCEEKFESDESSDDEGEEWSYPMGVPMIEAKGVHVGMGQRSQQNSLDTPNPISGIHLKEVFLQPNNLNEACDKREARVTTFSASEEQKYEFSVSTTSQPDIQEGQNDYSKIQKANFLGSLFLKVMQDESKVSNLVEIDSKTIHSKYPILEEEYQNAVFKGQKLDFEVVRPFSEILQMLKKQSLMVAKVFFHIEPILCHFEVKSDLSEVLLAANWWLKIILEMFLRCMSMFAKPKVIEVANIAIFEDHISIPEVQIAEFMISEVQD